MESELAFPCNSIPASIHLVSQIHWPVVQQAQQAWTNKEIWLSQAGALLLLVCWLQSGNIGARL